MILVVTLLTCKAFSGLGMVFRIRDSISAYRTEGGTTGSLGAESSRGAFIGGIYFKHISIGAVVACRTRRLSR